MSGGYNQDGQDYDMTNDDNGGDGWSEYEEEKESPAYYAAVDRDDQINFSNPSSRVSSSKLI